MKKLQFVFLSFLLSWVSVGTAGSIQHDNYDFSISDFDSVSEAVDAVKATLVEQGLEIVAVIDHAANAQNVDLPLPPTQLILFRDRHLEKKLLRRSPTVGIDLPQKILVWEDETSGKIKLFYNTASYLSDRHGIRIRDRTLSKLNNRLNQFGRLINGLITIKSEHSVEETAEKLKTLLLKNGFFVPLTFDFSGKSYYRNYRKPVHLIIFGNPKVGTPLMQNRQSVGVDLPQKFLIWQDTQDQVHITYNDPLFIGKRHGLQGLDNLLGNISNRLGRLAAEGAGTASPL